MSIEHIRVILLLVAFTGTSPTRAQSIDAEMATTPAPPAAVETVGQTGSPTVVTEGAKSDGGPQPTNDRNGSSPAAVVERLSASLQKVLEEAEQLGYEGRVERLSPILDAAFDFRYMAEKTVGRHWSTLTPEEQTRWVEIFADLTKATYAGRFDRFTGQKFELVGEQPGANDTIIVRSKVVSPGEDDVALSYRLSATPAGWKVIDVYFKGTVSELAMRRADYSSVLKNDGFEALVTRVNEKITQLSAGENP